MKSFLTLAALATVAMTAPTKFTPEVYHRRAINQSRMQAKGNHYLQNYEINKRVIEKKVETIKLKGIADITSSEQAIVVVSQISLGVVQGAQL